MVRKRCGLLYLKRRRRKGRRESHIPPTPLANTANIMHEAQLGTCSVRTKYTSSVNKFVYALQGFFLGLWIKSSREGFPDKGRCIISYYLNELSAPLL